MPSALILRIYPEWDAKFGLSRARIMREMVSPRNVTLPGRFYFVEIRYVQSK